MYFYSEKSRNKVVHTDKCFHILRACFDNVEGFNSLHEAYNCGYRLCRHCNPMRKQYKQECEEILKRSAEYGLSVHSGNRYIWISSVASKWKITLDSEKRMVLYHKNEFEKPEDSLSHVFGYHLQGDIKENNIVAYLDYIIGHDYFRMVHPVKKPKKKKNTTPPRKGTKRYKSAQRRNEKNQRRRAIQNVLDLIDSLSAPSNPA